MKPIVLVFDDNPEDIVLELGVLDRAGFEVEFIGDEEAGTARLEALALEPGRVCGLFIDVMLPLAETRKLLLLDEASLENSHFTGLRLLARARALGIGLPIAMTSARPDLDWGNILRDRGVVRVRKGDYAADDMAEFIARLHARGAPE